MAEVTGTYSSGFFEGTTVAGVPTDSFPSTGSAQVQWLNASNFDKKGILILNSDGSNSLDYYVTFKLTSSAPEYFLPSWGTDVTPLTLAAGESAYIAVEDSVAELHIYFKNNTPASDAAYEVRVAGQVLVSFQPRRSGRAI